METIDLPQLTDLLTSGGFAAIVWFLIARTLPAMQKRFDDASAAERELYRLEQREERELHRTISEQFLRTMEDVRLRCNQRAE